MIQLYVFTAVVHTTLVPFIHHELKERSIVSLAKNDTKAMYVTVSTHHHTYH